ARFAGAFGVLARNLVFDSAASFVIDIASNVVGQFFGQLSGRPLSQAEKNLTSAIFGDQIPAWRVKVVPESGWVDFLSAGLDISGQTNGSVVFLATPRAPYFFDYTDGSGTSRKAVIPTLDVLGPEQISTFVHEMTHVYQKYTELESVSGRALGEG